MTHQNGLDVIETDVMVHYAYVWDESGCSYRFVGRIRRVISPTRRKVIKDKRRHGAEY